MVAVLMTKTIFAASIPWERDATWVQDYGLVRIEERNAAKGMIALRRQNGEEFEILADTFERLYGRTVRENIFKPLRNPVLAWITSEPQTLVLETEKLTLAAGDVVMRDQAGCIKVVNGPLYASSFRATLKTEAPTVF
jgi:hypothetical protein